MDKHWIHHLLEALEGFKSQKTINTRMKMKITNEGEDGEDEDEDEANSEDEDDGHQWEQGW